MSSALDLVLTALQQNRTQRISREKTAIEAEDSRQDWTGEYAGVVDGQHMIRLPNGGVMPVEPTSNGSIERGALCTASKGAGDTVAYAQWMPQ